MIKSAVKRSRRSSVREKIVSVFEQNVFTEKVMKKMLDKKTFAEYRRSLSRDIPLTKDLADRIAAVMKEWALSLGATHYAHWFQPMTGQMAEKHDSFIDRNNDGDVIEYFSGSALMQGESDASSFPSGGMRSTFEARGYTSWDPSSPAFIMEGRGIKTLCIPSLFVAYNGELLDRKVPLIKSGEALKTQVRRISRLFGGTGYESVTVNVGVEQEFFLVDADLYRQRPDLIACGRTVYGAAPAKGQILGDHYFGAIPGKVLAFMADAEQRLLKLGVPVKTRHNEVAPSQFEMTQLYEDSNIACDHNMLMMEVLKQTAEEHGFVCLLHEKPFSGVNGSGKHNNWSLSVDGKNILDMGKDPENNLFFLVFVAAVLKAVHQYGVAFRLATSCAGNDYRLGENEAPPAIVSVFLGEQLDNVVESIVKGDGREGKSRKQFSKVKASPLPLISRDTSDRNRTSPLAFTGNKFEFRTVGSSQSVAQSNIVLNIAVAKALSVIADGIETETAAGAEVGDAVRRVLAASFKADKIVINAGDNYSKEWEKEAERRGLPNLKSCVDAFRLMDKDATMDLFTSFDLFSPREVSARKDILLNIYAGILAVEAEVCIEMGKRMIVPVAYSYLRKLMRTYTEMREINVNSNSSLRKLIDNLAENVDALGEVLESLEKETFKIKAAGNSLSDEEKAVKYNKRVVPLMKQARCYADFLEKNIDNRLLQFPTYNRLLSM